MTDSTEPVVMSVSSFVDARLIDGGDTVVMHFEAPDGCEVAMLIPRQAA